MTRRGDAPALEVASPLGDGQRLRALAATGLLDTPPSEAMQRISRLVSHLVRAPVALASFVDEERQFFVAATGFDVEPFASRRQTPLSHSFCQHVVIRGAPLIVSDARTEAFLEDNLAIGELGVIAYLGVPLFSPEGDVLGSLCAIDGKPREWTDQDELAMRDLGDLVCDELRFRRSNSENERLSARLQTQTWSDDLTGLRNRRYWQERVPVELARALRETQPVSVIMFDLDGFKAVNDELGHAAGDEILRSLGRVWAPLVRPPDILVRWGGDEFAAFLVGATEAQALSVADRLTAAAAHITAVSTGAVGWDRTETVAELLGRADALMLTRKRANPRR